MRSPFENTSYNLAYNAQVNRNYTVKAFGLRKLKPFFSMLLLLFAMQASSQGFNERIYESYIKGDMKQWLDVMNEMQSTIDLIGSEALVFDLAVAQYGYIAFKLSSGDKDEAKKYIRKIEDNLDQLEDKYPYPAKIHAIKGAVQGYKVGLNSYNAVFFGRKAFTENNIAMELSPNDPQVWMEKGNIELFKPEIFNPDSREAARIYRKSISLYEAEKGGLKHNWLYLNTLINLATSYIASGDYKTANATYQKLLQQESQLEWISNDLYPAFKRKYGF